jgi:hypothetical protein
MIFPNFAHELSPVLRQRHLLEPLASKEFIVLVTMVFKTALILPQCFFRQAKVFSESFMFPF